MKLKELLKLTTGAAMVICNPDGVELSFESAIPLNYLYNAEVLSILPGIGVSSADYARAYLRIVLDLEGGAEE